MITIEEMKKKTKLEIIKILLDSLKEGEVV